MNIEDRSPRSVRVAKERRHGEGRRNADEYRRLIRIKTSLEGKIPIGLRRPSGHGETQNEAIGYMRTSSATNVGRDKDSEVRQRIAIESYAKAAGYTIMDWFYDPAVKGSDAVTERPGFKDMLDRIAGNGVRTIIVESPDRFARDLAVQLAGHDFLKNLGVALIPATAPDFFTEDTPTAALVRQVLGAIAQFEKASLVAKLQAARDRKIAQGIKCGGRDLRGAIP
jgi:DNA invertase Pin-like site-specific DNA recombinase